MGDLWFLLDLIVVAIIVLFAILSAKRGFVKTIVEFVGFFLALYVSFAASGAIAESLYNNKLEPYIVNAATEKITGTAGSAVDSTIDSVWEELPAIVKNSATFFGVDSDTVSSTINQQLSDSSNVEEIAKTMAQEVLKPVVVPIIKTFLGMILFIILLILVKIVARVINRVFKLPLVGGLNHFLGAILGMGKGLIISAVICVAISAFIAVTGKEFLFFTRENIDKSLLFSLLANISF